MGYTAKVKREMTSETEMVNEIEEIGKHVVEELKEVVGEFDYKIAVVPEDWVPEDWVLIIKTNLHILYRENINSLISILKKYNYSLDVIIMLEGGMTGMAFEINTM